MIMVVSSLVFVSIMADSIAPDASIEHRGKLYIVFCAKDAAAFCIKTLAKIVGSEKVAKERLVYTYDTLGGFSAMLTPVEAFRLSREKGVYYVAQDKLYHIVRHASGGR
ncbi:hypothetical protein ACHQM5_006864 [Ranunculus cassubicifolius]